MPAKCQACAYPDRKTIAQLAVSRSWLGKVRMCCISSMKIVAELCGKACTAPAIRRKGGRLTVKNTETEW